MRLRLRTRRAGENFHLKLPNNITQKLQSNKQGSSTTDVARVLCQWWIFAIQFGASLLMHIQGLSALMEYQKSVNVATKALTGAGLEGVLIFSLLYFLLLSTNRLLGIGLALVIAIASTTCLLADYTFQTKTQGELPDMWTILLGLKEVWPNLKGEFSSNAGHLACCSGRVASLCRRVQSEFKSWSSQYNTTATTESARTSSLLPCLVYWDARSLHFGSVDANIPHRCKYLW